MASRRILPPLSIPEILTIMMEFSDSEFSILQTEIKSRSAFDSSSERSADISKRIGLDQESVGYLLSFLEFMYIRMHNENGSDDSRMEMIDSFLSSIIFESEEGEPKTDHDAAVSRLRSRMMALSEFNEHAEVRRKVERLKHGFLPNAVAFSSFVDLRPVMDEDRENILGYVMITQLRISTEQSQKEDAVVLQLSAGALSKLSEAVDDAKKKLALLRSDDFLSPRIMN